LEAFVVKLDRPDRQISFNSGEICYPYPLHYDFIAEAIDYVLRVSHDGDAGNGILSAVSVLAGGMVVLASRENTTVFQDEALTESFA
jgi:hypothetical protein